MMPFIIQYKLQDKLTLYVESSKTKKTCNIKIKSTTLKHIKAILLHEKYDTQLSFTKLYEERIPNCLTQLHADLYRAT